MKINRFAKFLLVSMFFVGNGSVVHAAATMDPTSGPIPQVEGMDQSAPDTSEQLTLTDSTSQTKHMIMFGAAVGYRIGAAAAVLTQTESEGTALKDNKASITTGGGCLPLGVNLTYLYLFTPKMGVGLSCSVDFNFMGKTTPTTYSEAPKDIPTAGAVNQVGLIGIKAGLSFSFKFTESMLLVFDLGYANLSHKYSVSGTLNKDEAAKEESWKNFLQNSCTIHGGFVDVSAPFIIGKHTSPISLVIKPLIGVTMPLKGNSFKVNLKQAPTTEDKDVKAEDKKDTFTAKGKLNITVALGVGMLMKK